MRKIGGGINEKLRRTSLPVLEKEIYQYLRLLRQQNRGAYKKLVDYYNTYPFWGGLDPDKKNFETLKRRAAVLKNHREDLDWLHSRLGDTLSKNTLSAILKNWLVFDCSDIVSVTRPAPDYFDTSLIPSVEGEVLVDLGAYTGDTIQDFVNTYGNSYKKIYAYEITKEILPLLEENTKYFHDVTIVNKAAGSQAGTLYVQAGSDASANTLSDDETNGYSVEVTAIDDDIPEPVTFIKMDIEGAEAEALLGCKRQIQENHPKLAVCLYHGYDDLWKLPRMIEEMDPTYQFYLRHYGGNLVPTEFVLLAI